LVRNAGIVRRLIANDEHNERSVAFSAVQPVFAPRSNFRWCSPDRSRSRFVGERPSLHIRRRFCLANQYDNAFTQLTEPPVCSPLDIRPSSGASVGSRGRLASRALSPCTAQCRIADNARGTLPGPPHHLRRRRLGFGWAVIVSVAGGQRRPCAARRFSGGSTVLPSPWDHPSVRPFANSSCQ
jgi:hypothetical protein